MNIQQIRDAFPAEASGAKILGAEKYHSAAVLIPLFELDGETHVLFQERAANIPQEGEICFPGGRIDPAIDRNSKEAAVRETAEELGLDRSKIDAFGYLGTQIAKIGNIIEAYMGILEIKSLDELKPSPAEVAKVFSLPLQRFIDHPPETYHARLWTEPFYTDEDGKKKMLFPAGELGLPRKYHQPWGGMIYPIYVYRTHHGTIWGITAEILKEFVNSLKAM